jgi:N-hydroxyarylamine O-acetyltransferase
VSCGGEGPPQTDRGRGSPAGDREAGLDVGRYLDRIGLTAPAGHPGFGALGRLQRARVTSVPFENPSVVGGPYGERDGKCARLSVPHVYRKVVQRRRDGFCDERNGLVSRLLAELGCEVDRVAARVTSVGVARPPANHLTNLHQLDRRHVVDTGVGVPVTAGCTPRRDGTDRRGGRRVARRGERPSRPPLTGTGARTPTSHS